MVRVSRRVFLAGSSLVVGSAVLGFAIRQALQSSSPGFEASGPGFGPWETNFDGIVESVSIEADGWTLLVTGRWPPSGFDSFRLDPDIAPTVAVIVRSAGFEQVGDRIFPCHKRRVLVATKPLRRSVAGPPLDLTSLDESDLGDGRRQVRLALSDYVHLGDIVDEVEFVAGWRTGLPDQRLQALNGSLKLVELPTMRWVVPARIQVTRTSELRAELLVASAWAEGLKPVAGVEFTATDGLTTVTNLQFDVSPSVGWGDTLATWGVALTDLCSGLRPGPVTIHARIYPHVGPMRATGEGHTTDLTACFGLEAEVPLSIIWDPDGTHMPEAHVYVDPVAGVLDAAAVTVASTLGEARAGVAARTVSVAAQAVYLARRIILAANGCAGTARGGDNAILTLAPGLNRFGTQSITSGAATPQGRMIIQGDPAEPDPAAAVILDVGDRPSWRYTAMLIRDLTLRVGGASLPFASAAVHFHNVHVRSRPGFELSTTAILSSASDQMRVGFTRCTWRDTAASLRAARLHLVRSCGLAQPAVGAVLLGNVRIDDGSDGFYIGNFAIAGNPRSGRDQILWGNRIYGCRTTALILSGAPNPADARLQQLIRLRVINNLFEMCPPRGRHFTGVGNPPSSRNLGSLGEGRFISAIDCLFENNSFVGQRYSWGYNDPGTADVALQNRHLGTRFRNSYTDRSATKHDDFRDSRWGVRPGFTGSWSILYGVGHRSNVLGLRWSNFNGFKFEFDGLAVRRSDMPGFAQGNSWVQFADDRCQFGLGSNQNGFGDYTPLPGSPLERACSNGNAAHDVLGRARRIPFAAGCFAADDS